MNIQKFSKKIARGFFTLFFCSVLISCSTMNTDSTLAKVDSFKITPTSTLIPPHSKITVQNIPFPRLVNWWPNPHAQPLQDIAKFNYILLSSWDIEYINPIRQLNPDVIIIANTNAIEVPIDPASEIFDPEIRNFPPQWFLTLVGTTLVSDVDKDQTILPVERLTVSDGIDTYQLFEAGDDVLIDGESVHVNSVDFENKTLSVDRGYVRPASAHLKGTRVATHFTVYPGYWVVNISTIPPKGIIDPSIGPETWANYRSRKNAKLVASGSWDGIFVDRSSPNLHFNRPIDPDQSNLYVKDQTAFQEKWNDGLLLYLQELRERIGPEKIIQLNNGVNAFDLANGTNFEGFPMDNADHWHSYILGPNWYDYGSYFEWTRNARQPNMTLIETYDDDSGLRKPVVNFRKMRLGLTTALLSDGFYGFISGNGYDPDGLKWFDEYDNAGTALGYLGQPLGPAKQIELGPFIPVDVVKNGVNSESDLAMWQLNLAIYNEASFKIDNTEFVEGSGSLQVVVTNSLGSDWHARVDVLPISISEKTNYTLSFMGKSDQPRPMSVWIQEDHDPWKYLVTFPEIQLTPEWQKYTLTNNSLGGDDHALLGFAIGKTNGTLWIDDVHLQTAKPDVFRRDFENGIVIVNASKDSVTIPLGETLKKINGTQDRLVNDGSMVTEVTIPALDGIILLRP